MYILLETNGQVLRFVLSVLRPCPKC